MAMYKFTATGKREGKTFVLLDKYQFVNGELIATGKEARAYKPILCDFYACKVEKVVDPQEAEMNPDDPDNEDDIEIAPPAVAVEAPPVKK